MPTNNIRYLRREEIDIAKWNECIEQAPNGLVYATSTYLDSITAWDALVQSNYDAVMPLPRRKKFGFHYLYQPFFCQQLGVFSKSDPGIFSIDDFLQEIPSFYTLWHLHLNSKNVAAKLEPSLRKNYLLSLDNTYENLRGEYSRSAKRNLGKAQNADVVIKESIAPDIVIQLHRRRFGTETGVPARDYKSLAILFAKLLSEERIFTAAAVNTTGKIIASSVYLVFKDRLTFILNGNLPESLEMGATHYLKDHVIRKFANSQKMIDFEGSDNPAFARFYEQFGAKTVEYYPVIYNNKLPWPFRFLKK